MNIPVTLFIFNRPDLVAGLLDRLREVKPSRLLVVADGARNEAESERVEACRRLIDQIDWPCEIHKDYAETNLGCGRRIQTGLDRAFELFERSIILEDDIYPDVTFFAFCEEMLERYADDTRIMTVTGGHFLKSIVPGPESYYFSIFPSAWGWATWRRAWKTYDREMSAWPRLKAAMWLMHHLHDAEMAAHYTRGFDLVSSGRLDTWDFQLVYSAWTTHALSIVPKTTLCQNFGFRPDATHTTGPNRLAHINVRPLEFPLMHPSSMIPSPAGREFYRREHVPAGPRI